MAHTDEVTALVERRRSGAQGEIDTGRRILAECVDGCKVRTEAPVCWSSRRWTEAHVWSESIARRIRDLEGALVQGTCSDGRLWISRADVFSRAEVGGLDLFLAVMAWGFGSIGYGWRRRADILKRAGEREIGEAVDRLRVAAKDGPEAAWRAWSRGGSAKVGGLGTAFASKVAYFAAYDRDVGRGPLIADRNTACALWALDGRWDSRASTEAYGGYVAWAERMARELGCHSDDIERALFTIGPHVRRPGAPQRARSRGDRRWTP
jgi:hypothetical protein